MANNSKKSTAVRTGIQPLFKWAGSKQRMLEGYDPYFWPNQPFTRFVDLFAGGLSMTLWVAEHYPNAKLVINEWNDELVQLYKTLATKEQDVIDVWQSCVDAWLPKTSEQRKEYYYTLREEYTQDHTSKTPVRLSGLLLFMLQVNFNGMWKAYIKCNGRYSTPPGTCLQGKAFFDVNKIRAVAKVLRNADILSGDYKDVPLLPGDFVYADPPYRDSIVDYQGGFGEDAQQELIQHLVQSGCLFAYSNKDIGDGFFETHFDVANNKNVTIYPMDAKYTAGRGTSVISVKEVLITNYSPTSGRHAL